MVARKAVKVYVVGSKENGFAANAFLRTALVKSTNTKPDPHDINPTENDTHICQVLTFRGRPLGITTLSFIVGTVNLLCSIFWAVFIASEGNHGKWNRKKGIPANSSKKPRNAPPIMPACAVIALEIMCIASGSVALGVLGIKSFKTWVYSVVQALVWVKWGIGSYLLGELHSESNSEYNWKRGILVYSSSFFLNFMLAAVRCSWHYSRQC
eukprot:PITA_18450